VTHSENGTGNGSEIRGLSSAEGVFLWE
jgi:hypothetical protein